MQRAVFTWTPGAAVCDWLLLDPNGNREGAVARTGTLDELFVAAAGRELVWLAPGQEAVSLSANLPVKGRDKVLRALPYALEEQLAEDPAQVFFALPGRMRDDVTWTIAVDSHWLTQALEELAEHGLSPARVVPDYLAVPQEPQGWSVLADTGVLYVRTAESVGFSLEADTGWTVLRRRVAAIEESSRPRRIRFLRGREPCGTAPDLELLEPDAEPALEGLLGVVPAGLDAGAVNLLQGPFNPRRHWRALVRPWLPAAGALAAVVLLALAGFVASWVENAHAAASLRRDVVARFHRLLPGQPLVDVRAQVEQRLQGAAGGGSHSGFLPLLAALTQAGGSGISIESMTYQAGELDLQVHAQDVPSLEDMRNKLASATGQPVKIRDANQTKSGVEGSLSIGGGGQ